LEDISIDTNYKGRNLVVNINAILMEFGKINNCYKIVLECADHNIKFYEKIGYILKGKNLVWYRSESKL
jgi:glucosamine-phosphate N-acetyltransferase